MRQVAKDFLIWAILYSIQCAALSDFLPNGRLISTCHLPRAPRAHARHVLRTIVLFTIYYHKYCPF